MAIAIVTDSTSDIEPEEAARLGITVVPLFIVFGERSYRDYVDLSRADFYHKLAHETTLPITSQPTAQMFEDAFAPLVARGDEILCITLSSHLSGTINAARAGAQRFPNARIEMYDSQTASSGLGMLVRRALALVNEAKAMPEIVAALDRERAMQRLYACIPELSHLQRTGRIGKAQAAIGTLMKIVPVLCLKDGQVAAETQVRTFARAQDAMLDLTMKAAPDIARARFTVIHTNAPHLAEHACEKLRARFEGRAPRAFDIVEAGPAIATHAGAGAVGIFAASE